MPVSTSLDPFLKLIKNIEELETEWCKESNVDETLRLPVCICVWNKSFYIIR